MVDNILKKIPSRHLGAAPPLLAALVFVLALSAGCSHRELPEAFLFPGQYALEGYSAEGDTVIYEDSLVKIRAHQIRDKSSMVSSLSSELFDEGFVLVQMEITNKSRYRLLYDPALTLLRDSKMGYFKPLDFTDLYMLKIKKKRLRSPLEDAAKTFYDLAERIGPGESRSKILVFPALTEKADEAELVMKSIYVGKEILDLTFNFVIRPEEEKMGPS